VGGAARTHFRFMPETRAGVKKRPAKKRKSDKAEPQGRVQGAQERALADAYIDGVAALNRRLQEADISNAMEVDWSEDAPHPGPELYEEEPRTEEGNRIDNLPTEELSRHLMGPDCDDTCECFAARHRRRLAWERKLAKDGSGEPH
jgi:hypothetical protein